MKRITFVLIFLFYLITHLYCANISVKLDLIRENDKFYLIIKNAGNVEFKTKKIIVIFNQLLMSNNLELLINPLESTKLELPITTPLIPGSYNLSVKLIYLNEGNEISSLINNIFDFDERSIIDLKGKIKSSGIYFKGLITVKLKNREYLQNIIPILPDEFSYTSYISHNKLLYYIENKTYSFMNNYTVYFTIDTIEYKNGKQIHSAGFISSKIRTGEVFYHIYKSIPFTIGLTIVLLLIIISLIIITVLYYKKYNNPEKGKFFLCLTIVSFLSFLTYITLYYYPAAPFWDENYHIASAQKYIDRVFFMEPHPPLGKMFIALGEIIFNVNDGLDKNGFLKTDHIKNFPPGYSFIGVRFFPTIFAGLSGILFFLILYLLSKNPVYSLLFSSLYICDNALICHSRSAMLDSTQIFFILASILYFLYIVEKKNSFIQYLILGLITSLAISVKITSLILLILFVSIFIYEYRNEILNLKFNFDIIKEMLLKIVFSIIGLLIPFLIIFYIHCGLGQNIAREDNGNLRIYKASDKYLEIIKYRETWNILNFPLMLKDNFIYMDNYQKGVPKLDPCKEGENGSHPMGWPIGKKSINYRWSKMGNKVFYMYLQGNPIIWFTGLFGIIFSISLILGKLLYNLKIKNLRLFSYILMFTTMYILYMFQMIRIDRVMYLYHYFIPLIFSLITAYLVFNYIFEDSINNKNKVLLIATIIFTINIIIVFIFFSPFCYYLPLTSIEFLQRTWFKFWGLKYVGV